MISDYYQRNSFNLLREFGAYIESTFISWYFRVFCSYRDKDENKMNLLKEWSVYSEEEKLAKIMTVEQEKYEDGGRQEWCVLCENGEFVVSFRGVSIGVRGFGSEATGDESWFAAIASAMAHHVTYTWSSIHHSQSCRGHLATLRLLERNLSVSCTPLKITMTKTCGGVWNNMFHKC